MFSTYSTTGTHWKYKVKNSFLKIFKRRNVSWKNFKVFQKFSENFQANYCQDQAKVEVDWSESLCFKSRLFFKSFRSIQVHSIFVSIKSPVINTHVRFLLFKVWALFFTIDFRAFPWQCQGCVVASKNDNLLF